MSSEPHRLHPAAIAVLALGALREAAVPIVILLGASIAGRGLDTGALERSAFYLVIGVAIATLTGLHALAQHELRRRRARRALQDAGSSARRRRRSRSAASRGSTPWRARCSACSASSRCTCSRPAAARRARSCSRPSAPTAVERIRAAVGAAAPELAEAAAAPPRDRAPARPPRAGRRGADGGPARRRSCPRWPPRPSCSATRSRASATSRTRRGCCPTRPAAGSSRSARWLVAAWALSAIGSIVSFAGFAVARDGDRLRIRRGLLQRSDAVVPVRRIHAVRVVEGVLRRPFGLATLRLEVAGYAEERVRRPHAVPAAAARRGRRLPRRAAARAGRRARRPHRPAGARGAPLRPAARRSPAWSRRRRLPARPGRVAVAAARSPRCSRSTAGGPSRPPAGACATAGSRCARACSPAPRS